MDTTKLIIATAPLWVPFIACMVAMIVKGEF